MARSNAVNFTGPLQFPYATAGTDIFKKEDVQVLAQAVDQHDHSSGKGLALSAGAIPTGSITSAMIADGTIQSADIATGAITTTQIADGTIQSADIAAAGIANDRLGPDVARANLLTNPGFEIWQRGNGPITANANFTADRWQISLTGSDTMSVSKNTANQDAGSVSCAGVTFTLGTGNGSQLTQLLSDFGGQIQGRAASLSMRVRASASNAVRVGLYDGGAWHYSAYHTGSGAYETLTATTTVLGLPGYVSVFFMASCTAYLDNACLVWGSQPATYVPLHPADDVARCLRYYEVVGQTINTVAISGYASASNNFYTTLPYRALKPVVPTFTKVGTWSVGNANQPATYSVGADAASINVTSVAAGYYYAVNGNAGNMITIEANP